MASSAAAVRRIAAHLRGRARQGLLDGPAGRIVDREKVRIAGGKVARNSGVGIQQRTTQHDQFGAQGIRANRGLVGVAHIAFHPVDRKQGREQGGHRYGKNRHALGAQRNPGFAVMLIGHIEDSF